jgi:hypothetical protein
MAKRVVFILIGILFAKVVAVEPTITPPPDLSNRQISAPDNVIGYVNFGDSCNYIGIPVNFRSG